MKALEKTKRQHPRNPLAAAKAQMAKVDEVSMDKIDPPARAMRETMDEDKLHDLIRSMGERGLIQPIALLENGVRFEVLAGHRRFLAAQALGWKTITAMVYPHGTKATEAIKAHENTMREAVNAAEEARWLWQVMETECSGDTITLATRMGLRVDYCENRLNLVRGDQDVFTALAKSEIGIGVAMELNLVKDTVRRKMLLQAAVEGGCSLNQMKRWRSEGNALDAMQPAPPIVEHVHEVTGAGPAVPTIECTFCGEGPDAGAVETLYVHRTCHRNFLKQFERLQLERSGGNNG